ncbi:hypothetical protein CCAX7_002680 [Capsulimonas corticalis]|uniref:Uncharacterized protein n=1 Tax=Capsulimonas corticalis TaxID=2219043 RepID=A0A402CS34_9BACT|nr:AraC family transcriptional regulator [Capsulimonas corticalis]BDI28217.1 hypothetical protein CCAX7_002680 [Capsulimonas corticalis]
MPKEDLHLPVSWDGSIFFHTPDAPASTPHRHEELEFNLVTAGRAAYLLGERRYELTRNSLVWLFPEQDHVLLDRSPDHAMWIGLFKPDLLSRLDAGSRLDADKAVLLEPAPAGNFCRRISEADGARLSALLDELQAVRQDTPWFNAGLGYLLFMSWGAYLAAEESAAGPDVHPAVEQTARLLRDDPEPLTVDQLAARVGLSASYLGRLFHQQTGITLVEFRNRQRMDRFLRLYDGEQKISALEAALETGFGSYPQFHRVFTEQMGCSPAEYKRKRQQGRRPQDE